MARLQDLLLFMVADKLSLYKSILESYLNFFNNLDKLNLNEDKLIKIC